MKNHTHFHTLPRQNRDGKLLFLLVALNLWIYFPFTNK